MGKKAAPPKSEKDRSERWLLTYSDLITLLMVFFVVLYSMSVLDANKFNAMAQAMSVAFTGGGGGNGVLDAGRSIVPGESIYKERLELQNTQKKIRKMIAKKNLEDKISTEIGERGLVISVKDTILFLPGAVTLAPSARELITSVAAILAKMPNSIRIEGHTEDQPIHTERYFSNWELSTARATNVLQYFIQDGIKPSRLCAAGYGEFKPLVQNTSEHNRGLNRRVDIVLVSNEANKYEPGSIIKPGLDDSLDGAATKLYSDRCAGGYRRGRR
jgi:chemotaxis protein MotB